MSVFVLDKKGKPLMPCTEKRARLLLARGRARVHRVLPFVIRIIDRQVSLSGLQPVRVKLDPGSKVTGIAIVRDNGGAVVLHTCELEHHGSQIREKLTQRRAFRRRRRNANLRYRAPRFDNRTKVQGWLAPSLQHRVDTVMSWLSRFRQWLPVTAISVEVVRFDSQKMLQPEISGIEYQQGTLAGYEVREYLLEKWGRKCAYCGAENTPLEIDHIHPRSKGGSSRISNLILACHKCNELKGNKPVEVFVRDKDRLAKIIAQASQLLADAAAVNSTRSALLRRIEELGLPVEASSGGLTKWNRIRLGIPKTHALDAACVGNVNAISAWACPALIIKACGRGSYQRTRLTPYGFPRGYLMRQKQVKGFQTGDMVKANVVTGKKTGTYFGRVAVRSSGSFNIQSKTKTVEGISHKHCRVIQRGDGYAYFGRPFLPPPEGSGYPGRGGR